MDKIELRRYAIKERVVHGRSLSRVLSSVKSKFGVELSARSVQRRLRSTKITAGALRTNPDAPKPYA